MKDQPTSRKEPSSPSHDHGWHRGEWARAQRQLSRPRSANSSSLTLILSFCVALSTLWGLGRVRTHHRRLVAGEQLARLTHRYHALLDQKNRVLAELAHLRDPERIRTHAARHLQMQRARPEHFERIPVQRKPGAQWPKPEPR